MKQNEKMKAMLQQIKCWQIIHEEKENLLENIQLTSDTKFEKTVQIPFWKKLSKANVLRNNAF